MPCAIFDHGLPVEPDSPPEVEILMVSVNGVDIRGLLPRNELDSIAQMILGESCENTNLPTR